MVSVRGFGFCVIFCLVVSGWASVGRADNSTSMRRLEIPEAGVAFLLPAAAWRENPFSPSTVKPKMTPTDPLYLGIRRQPIVDPTGVPVTPAINITAFRQDRDISSQDMADALVKARHWTVLTPLVATDVGLPNAVGFIASFDPRPDVKIFVLDVQTLRDGVFVEISMSATDRVFPQLKDEFRTIARNLVRIPVKPLAGAETSNLFPWRAGDAPPRIGKLGLGDSKKEIVTALGRPDLVTPMGDPASGVECLSYNKLGMTVIISPADGASVIRLTNPVLAIGGIKTGDDKAALLAKWGQPGSSDGPKGIYTAGVWSIGVELIDDGTRIKGVQLAWNTSKWGDAYEKADPTQIKAYRPN